MIDVSLIMLLYAIVVLSSVFSSFHSPSSCTAPPLREPVKVQVRPVVSSVKELLGKTVRALVERLVVIVIYAFS